MALDRRSLLKGALTAGAAAATGALPRTAAASERKQAPPDAVGMLYDATKCIGCKTCVVACHQENFSNPFAEEAANEQLWFDPVDLDARTRNIIKLFKDGDRRSYVKRQCMHCIDPACANACMLGALQKREKGIVSWDPARCIGCRYCEVACPFNVPKFEWSSNNPRIVKCELCRDRQAQGKEPACTEVCPAKAVIFGKYDELLAEAHRRLEENPDRYQPVVYGEKEGGGTQVIYLAGSQVSFEKLGFPPLTDQPVPEPARTLQHGIYKGFIAPAALYAVLGAVMWRNRRQNPEPPSRPAAGRRAEMATAHAAPVGGTLWTRPFKVLVTLGALGLVLTAWRFAVGLGASTGLSDGYPWGLWIAFDVVTGTALACGGYAVAILVYILNKGRYHPLVRPAILTSALGYSLAALAIVVDVGRPWFIWKVPLFFWRWNLNSALLEVALCVMAYVVVLWIEMSPAFLEKWEQESRRPGLQRFARKVRPRIEKALLWIIALGLLLPTMHQSSLGTVMLLAGPRLHPL